MTRVTLPLEIDELILRRVAPKDRADFFEYYSDLGVSRFQFWEPWNIEQTEHMIAEQLQVRPGDPGVPLILAAELKSECKVIGDCQLTINSVDDGQGEIGFTFNPAYCGRGLATKSTRAALGFGFTRLRLHRIVAAVDVRHEKCWRLLERVGMRREAHFLHDAYVKGEWVDDYVYAMLETEWAATGE